MWGLVDVSGTSVAELSVYLSDHSAQALHREAGTTCKNNIDFMFSHSPGHWSNILEGRYIIGIRMQNRQMTICEEISGPPVCPTDIFATRMHASCLCPGV